MRGLRWFTRDRKQQAMTWTAGHLRFWHGVEGRGRPTSKATRLSCSWLGAPITVAAMFSLQPSATPADVAARARQAGVSVETVAVARCSSRRAATPPRSTPAGRAARLVDSWSPPPSTTLISSSQVRIQLALCNIYINRIVSFDRFKLLIDSLYIYAPSLPRSG